MVAKVVARGARGLEYSTTMWKMIRRDSKEAIEADDGKVTQLMQGDTIAAFMGR